MENVDATRVALLAAIFDATPDGLLVVDREGVIRDANRQASTVFGYERAELIGAPIDMLLPERFRPRHVEHRAGFIAEPRLRAMGVGIDLYARRKDGTEIPVDVALGVVDRDGDPWVVAFVRDITERREAEEVARKLHEAEVARERAFELNDSVVQGIVAALLRLELNDETDSDTAEGLRATLEAARAIVSDLLGERRVAPGSLVRTTPADRPPG